MRAARAERKSSRGRRGAPGGHRDGGYGGHGRGPPARDVRLRRVRRGQGPAPRGVGRRRQDGCPRRRQRLLQVRHVHHEPHDVHKLRDVLPPRHPAPATERAHHREQPREHVRRSRPALVDDTVALLSQRTDAQGDPLDDVHVGDLREERAGAQVLRRGQDGAHHARRRDQPGGHGDDGGARLSGRLASHLPGGPRDQGSQRARPPEMGPG